MTAELCPNPPWVDKVLTARWDQLVDVAPEPAQMPEIARETRGGKLSFREYGCGHYGCVIPTGEPGVVFKVTSDPSEAAFVAGALTLPEWPAGMIRYYDIYELPERYRRRRVFALWRAEAFNIGALTHRSFPGGIDPRYVDRYGETSVRAFLHYSQQWLFTAGKMREQMRRSKDPAALLSRAAAESDTGWRIYADGGFRDRKLFAGDRVQVLPPWRKGPVAFAARRVLLEQLAVSMSHTHAGSLIGEAFDYYMEAGMLLADVHLNNVGEAIPQGYDEPDLVITDPGHMVPLDERWLEVAVPTLPAL